jgi:hypothetical protein
MYEYGGTLQIGEGLFPAKQQFATLLLCIMPVILLRLCQLVTVTVCPISGLLVGIDAPMA